MDKENLEDKMEKETRNKKKKKSGAGGPGHLKERNHFDGKDMILLVVTLLIIYGIMTWVEFFAQENMDQNANVSQETVAESGQTVSETE